jgi:hypothetical protein
LRTRDRRIGEIVEREQQASAGTKHAFQARVSATAISARSAKWSSVELDTTTSKLFSGERQRAHGRGNDVQRRVPGLRGRKHRAGRCRRG